MALVHNIHRSEMVAVMDKEDLEELRRSSDHGILPVFVESPFRDLNYLSATLLVGPAKNDLSLTRKVRTENLMSHFVCTTCGAEYADSSQPPC